MSEMPTAHTNKENTLHLGPSYTIIRLRLHTREMMINSISYNIITTVTIRAENYASSLEYTVLVVFQYCNNCNG